MPETAQIISVSSSDGGWLGNQKSWQQYTGQVAHEGYAWLEAIHPDDAAKTREFL